MSWGIKYALTTSVREHGELADDANIWSIVAIDPPFADDVEAWKFCDEEERDDPRYTYRAFEIEED